MPAKKKLDLYRIHKSEYATPREPVLVKVGPAKYLAIEGQGAPGSEEFQAKIDALYNVTFTIKMAEKFAGEDYTVVQCPVPVQIYSRLWRSSFYFDGDHNFSLFLRSAPALRVRLPAEEQFCASTKNSDLRERIIMRSHNNAAHR